MLGHSVDSKKDTAAGDSVIQAMQMLKVSNNNAQSILTPPPSEEKGNPSQKSSSNHSEHDTKINNDSNLSYVDSLREERDQLTQYTDGLKHVFNLIDKEIKRVSSDNQYETKITSNDNVLSEIIPIPIDLYPNYNFVGRILGPRGTTAKQLEAATGCKIVVNGRKRDNGNSTNGDSAASNDLNEPLSIQISCPAGDVGAAQRLEAGSKIIRSLLVPPADGQDELKRQQLMVLANMNGTYRPRTNSQYSTDMNSSNNFQNILPFGYRLPSLPTCQQEMIFTTLTSLGLTPIAASKLMSNQQKDCDHPKCTVLRNLAEHNVPLSQKYSPKLIGNLFPDLTIPNNVNNSNNNCDNCPKVDNFLKAMHWYDLINNLHLNSNEAIVPTTKNEDFQKAKDISRQMCASIGQFGVGPSCPSASRRNVSTSTSSTNSSKGKPINRREISRK